MRKENSNHCRAKKHLQDFELASDVQPVDLYFSFASFLSFYYVQELADSSSYHLIIININHFSLTFSSNINVISILTWIIGTYRTTFIVFINNNTARSYFRTNDSFAFMNSVLWMQKIYFLNIQSFVKL